LSDFHNIDPWECLPNKREKLYSKFKFRNNNRPNSLQMTAL
jgi:hypothetical protein